MTERAAAARPVHGPPPSFDLMRVPVLGACLRRGWVRRAVQWTLLVLAALLVLHGFLGPALAPKNLATVLVWVHYRGFLIFSLLFAGNLFCYGCPLLLPRDWVRRHVRPARRWPRALRRKWLATALFVGVLFAYELYDLWADPRWTAGLILGYFAAATIVDVTFERAAFCKFVCPIGQFNFVSTLLAPVEVRAVDGDTCASCRTKDCIRGRRDDDDRVVQRGCELDLYLPRKVGNMDCTFCLDCVQACPHDNVGIVSRVPGDELAVDPVRSGLGRFSRRSDLVVLVVVFTFGALLNAFGMVGPVYALQTWLAEQLGTKNEAVLLGLLFAGALVVLPALALGVVGAASRRLGRSACGLRDNVRRFAVSLAPIGVAVWAAHYGFHLLTGLWTFVPVARKAAGELGLPVGEPNWGRGGFTEAVVSPIETGLLILGLAGSLAVVLRIARRELPEAPTRGALPWVALHVGLFVLGQWLMAQPMEMRGTFL